MYISSQNPDALRLMQLYEISCSEPKIFSAIAVSNSFSLYWIFYIAFVLSIKGGRMSEDTHTSRAIGYVLFLIGYGARVEKSRLNHVFGWEKCRKKNLGLKKHIDSLVRKRNSTSFGIKDLVCKNVICLATHWQSRVPWNDQSVG